MGTCRKCQTLSPKKTRPVAALPVVSKFYVDPVTLRRSLVPVPVGNIVSKVSDVANKQRVVTLLPGYRSVAMATTRPQFGRSAFLGSLPRAPRGPLRLVASRA